MIINEIWKDIKNYEGTYQISNFGNVRNIRTNRIMIQSTRSSGYKQITLYNPNKTFRVHRLVAEAFIPNPNNLPQINHKDENKSNNRVDNLEWCTTKYNINYGNRNTKASKSLLGHKMFTDLSVLNEASHSKEAIEKRRKTMRERGSMTGENNPFYSKHHSEETKRKIGDRTKGKIWVTNVELHSNKQIDKSELDYYISLGYKKGFTKW